ncbi:tetratricopeptide repeat protein [Pedobacter psychroterrae]|uniref:Tetratricopeptide repeat protein n=1 Tax=Pedobacter psychroterrae TaxID=2530453 RepID=A0A4R0NJZ5_9SPHI|nr:tetratricopeptide repeat protein [Pedobacter psychroterrae]TCD01021.1 tetratricopeptide repeat protein [Pedobacter psychroterrae]
MYKRIFYLLVIIAFPLFIAAKEVPAKLLAEGNQQYAKGQFKDAVKTYGLLVDSGYRTASVYFNLGNAYYKLDELSSAIWYYEKAYKLTPGDEDIKVNLQFANLKITDKIEAVPEFFLAKWWRGFVMSVSLNTWAVSGILGLLSGFALLIVYLFVYVINIKKASFYAGISLVILGLFSLFMANSQSNYFERANQAIVFNGSVDVKSGPQASMKTLFVIHEGLKVNIKEKEGSWVKIELPNGNIGWIESVAVNEI